MYELIKFLHLSITKFFTNRKNNLVIKVMLYRITGFQSLSTWGNQFKTNRIYYTMLLN